MRGAAKAEVVRKSAAVKSVSVRLRPRAPPLCFREQPGLAPPSRLRTAGLRDRRGDRRWQPCESEWTCSTPADCLGWRALGGSKQRQNVLVPEWICGDRALSIHCLRGLIETDGCVYLDRGYQMVSFSTVIPGLAQQVDEMVRSLGCRPRRCRIRQMPRKGVVQVPGTIESRGPRFP